jgi:hypothetical protein|uniref:NADH-ubiquinone oxidoreductase n=1 Tax=Ackermannviridae sp. TaxID=2831612 RepID=A0A8S5VVS3_9CAUD|nr:MAG TPA: NADH-ubiquinone oxidoreductase [Ackermannviridae sp.]DAV58898.1 MAG TPA: NADH-ubiquinone oxidoreductase [Caudoviricetes sp.]
MDAVEFFKTVNRLCENQSCRECPVCKEGVCMVMNMVRIDGGLVESIEETVSKVEQWAKDHPVKTRQSEFLKLFPNATIDEDNGILCIKPCTIDESIGCTNGKGCDDCYRKYWLTEVTDNGNVY